MRVLMTGGTGSLRDTARWLVGSGRRNPARAPALG